jgi:hypothetical protein
MVCSRDEDMLQKVLEEVESPNIFGVVTYILIRCIRFVRKESVTQIYCRHVNSRA